KLKHYATWCHTACPIVNRPLTFTHTNFCRFRCNRQVREDTDPYTTRTFHVTSDRAAGRFDLTCCDAFRLKSLKTESTKIQIRTTFRITVNTALELFTELGALRLHHCSLLQFSRPRPALSSVFA